jgi:antitoxin component YwqK of YwqJK toxin-antitoxin module
MRKIKKFFLFIFAFFLFAIDSQSEDIAHLNNCQTNDPPANYTGLWVRCYQDGRKSRETEYLNGKKHGLEKTFFPDQQVQSQIEYKDGQINGLFTSWNRTGEKESAVFKDGRTDGPWFYFSKDGTIKNGKDTLISKDGTRIERTYTDGVKQGLETIWYPNGKKRQETNYKNGALHGISKTWRPDGSIERESHFKDGQSDGPFIAYYENGQKESEALKQNNKTITLKKWSKDGKIVLDERYAGCPEIDHLKFTDREISTMAGEHAKKSEKCATALKSYPKMIIYNDNPDLGLIARYKDGSATYEHIPYVKPSVKKTCKNLEVTFSHDGSAHDGPSYYIVVTMTHEGSLLDVTTRSEWHVKQTY